MQGTERDFRDVRLNFESNDQNPTFKDPLRSDELENLEGAETKISQKHPAGWDPEGSPNLAPGIDDVNLRTSIEESSSSPSQGVKYVHFLQFPSPFFLQF